MVIYHDINLCLYPMHHKTFAQCWINVISQSTTLAQLKTTLVYYLVFPGWLFKANWSTDFSNRLGVTKEVITSLIGVMYTHSQCSFSDGGSVDDVMIKNNLFCINKKQNQKTGNFFIIVCRITVQCT